MSEKSRRGFAGMDAEKRRAISRKGGQTAHRLGSAHKFNSQEAAEAGRKGGRSVSRDREHMAAIGRKGGFARGPGLEVRPSAESEQETPSDIGQRKLDECVEAELPPAIEDTTRSVGSIRVLLENGPFAGCMIQLDGENHAPRKLWLDSSGVVTAATTAHDLGRSSWVGRFVEPIPPINPGGDLLSRGDLAYEWVEVSERGYDAVLRFVNGRPGRPSGRRKTV